MMDATGDGAPGVTGDVALRKNFYQEQFDIITEVVYLFEEQGVSYPKLFSLTYPLNAQDGDPDVDTTLEGLAGLSISHARSEGLNEDLPQFDGNCQDWDAFGPNSKPSWMTTLVSPPSSCSEDC